MQTLIAVRKLSKLTALHRARKAAQTLELIEVSYRAGDVRAAAWVQELSAAIHQDHDLSQAVRDLAATVVPVGSSTEPLAEQPAELPTLLSSIHPVLLDPQDGARYVNRLRRTLQAHAGAAPADWDFLEPLGLEKGVLPGLDASARKVFPGVRAYLEDIRSPFNVGAMFRTADAYGVESLLLSPCCADPGHPRARRSAMGAVSTVPWRRADLMALADADNAGCAGSATQPWVNEIFALELRGEALDNFEFPEYGTVLLGSEELGVSPEALALCSRRVSIPMLGAKASLNVGVAFGILMDAWRRSLQRRGIQPD